jgi:hypothetical protein
MTDPGVVPVRVAALGRLHIIVGNHSLCGRVRVVADQDCYGNDVGLYAWNYPVIARCEMCERRLQPRAEQRAAGFVEKANL